MLSPRYLQQLLMLHYSHVLLLSPSREKNNMGGIGFLSERAYFVHKVFLLSAVCLTFHVFFVRSATSPASWNWHTW